MDCNSHQPTLPDQTLTPPVAPTPAAQTGLPDPDPSHTEPVAPLPIPDHLMQKNRLQEYTQKASLPLPVYCTVNEGHPHAPKFRAIVIVNGVQYASPNTFPRRKEAEQDAAKYALSSIPQQSKKEEDNFVDESSFVMQNSAFCKSILHELAAKAKLEIPNYSTIQMQPPAPSFVSSLVFNGIAYTGVVGRNKKEAEQVVARSVIQSLIGNSTFGPILSEIIKSKIKIHSLETKEVAHAQFSNGTRVGSVPNVGAALHIPSDTNEVVKTDSDNVVSKSIEEVVSDANQHPHIFKQTIKQPSEAINLPIQFVPSGQSTNSDSTFRKRKKNKKKANKKSRPDLLSTVAEVRMT